MPRRDSEAELGSPERPGHEAEVARGKRLDLHLSGASVVERQRMQQMRG